MTRRLRNRRVAFLQCLLTRFRLCFVPRYRCLPDSPVLLGWFVQNGLQKRIEAPERYLSIRPVIGGVAEDIEQLFAGLFVKFDVGRNMLEHR